MLHFLVAKQVKERKPLNISSDHSPSKKTKRPITSSATKLVWFSFLPLSLS